MSSLDYELENLKKPIPDGTDLDWLTSGGTFYQSDNVNPNAQASSFMNQLIFNRIMTKRANTPLLPEERAIGQTVIAHIKSGYSGNNLKSALKNIFGNEVCNRYASFINDVELLASDIDNLPSELNPKNSISLASSIDNNSDREALRKHEVKMSSNALQAYRSKSATMEDGSLSIDESEMDVDLTRVGQDKEVELSNGAIDQIKLAAQSIIKDNDYIGLDKQQDKLTADMVSSEDVKSLHYAKEESLLEGGKDELDLAFDNSPVSLGEGGFELNAEGALIGCDQDLADVAGVPPTALLESDDILMYENEDVCPEKEEIEIDLDSSQKQEDLSIGMSDEFEVEI